MSHHDHQQHPEEPRDLGARQIPAVRARPILAVGARPTLDIAFHPPHREQVAVRAKPRQLRNYAEVVDAQRRIRVERPDGRGHEHAEAGRELLVPEGDNAIVETLAQNVRIQADTGNKAAGGAAEGVTEPPVDGVEVLPVLRLGPRSNGVIAAAATAKQEADGSPDECQAGRGNEGGYDLGCVIVVSKPYSNAGDVWIAFELKRANANVVARGASDGHPRRNVTNGPKLMVAILTPFDAANGLVHNVSRWRHAE
ncbi:hypothetical protein RRF57_013270 [Xylaria bambusicola]|uniref:Uncharacterized protein n=1 Tax=Xylaria bambusicola TaxID=326684 RepID=A0AAN7URH0_9PEZI